MLQAVNATDLLEVFSGKNIEADQLVDLNLLALNMMGITSERARRFINDVQKEEKRKKDLYEKLKSIDCEEIFHNLVKTGFTAEELSSLDDDDLHESGFSKKETKTILKKIQIALKKGKLLNRK